VTTFKMFLRLAPLVAKARIPILIRGPHGIGKSALVYQIAESFGLPVIERRPSQMGEGELLGIPHKTIRNDKKVTEFIPLEFFQYACDNPCVLFLDEIDRAVLELRQACFQIMDSRTLNGKKLHRDTLIFAAINGGKYSSNYNVGDMGLAELSRYSVWDVEPTVSEWLRWGSGSDQRVKKIEHDQYEDPPQNIHPMITSFITKNPEFLEFKGDIEPNKIYPCRRSWKRLNDTLVGSGLINEPGNLLFCLSESFVGKESALALNDYIINFEHDVALSGLLKGSILQKKLSINQHMKIIDKLDKSRILSREITQPEADNIAKYLVSLPSEVSMKLLYVLTNHSRKNMIKVFSHEMDKNGVGACGKYIVDILTDE
jgi:hypothetical protein